MRSLYERYRVGTVVLDASRYVIPAEAGIHGVGRRFVRDGGLSRTFGIYADLV
jgi:hypothetical protein